MRSLWLACLLVATACSSSGPSPAVDLATFDSDQNYPARDLSNGGTHACSTVSDCRRYSNNCNACTCEALSVNEVDPVCNGTPVSCFVDPCSQDQRKLACAGGTCVLQ